VGGHCIGVDPYYLTHKAQQIGYHPEIILSGRRINDGMGSHIARRVIKHMIQRSIQVANANVLVLGLAFKENCPDLRNTRVVDVINSLREFNTQIDVYDPWVAAADAEEEYGLNVIDKPQPGSYDAVLLAVAHDQFRDMGLEAIQALCKPDHVIFDVKYLFPFEAGLHRL
jgi:UDP-N-acetyl-D-galactosamine dehydrogenase